MIFFLISPNSYQYSLNEKKMELRKLDPDLNKLLASKNQENVRVIVWLDKKISTNSFERLGKVRYKYDIIPAVAMEVPVDRLKDFEELSDVRKVVLDKKIQAFRLESMPLIKADAASVDFGVNGTGINVSVIDTGVYNHTEFQNPNRIIKQKCYCTGCCPPNNVDESDNATDDEGHGTHCAGIAVGEGNGNGRGVATNASLFAVKVLDSSGNGQDSDLVAAIDWSVSNGANVISLSLGAKYNTFTECYEFAFSEAVDNATKQGVVVVVSAGNEGSFGYETIAAPGCAKRAITVGATDDNDDIAAFSSRGPTNDNRTKPDLTAPGVDIYSTYHTNPYYATGGGTSQAAPHVTGVAALLMQKYNQNHGYLPDPDMVKAILLTAVNTTGMENVGYEQRNNVYGAGRIDAYEALRIMNFTRNNTISQGQEHRYKINVTSDDLRVTLYWPEDKDTNNNLDLIIGNRSYNFSYTTHANDSIEQVFRKDANEGFWNVFVKGINGNNQEYYIASNMEIFEDVTPPSITLALPDNTTYSNRTFLPLNFTTDETNQTIWYTINGVNETVVTGNNTFNVSDDGAHKLTLYVNDSYDNINQTNRYFSVDTTPPKYFDNSTNSTVAGAKIEFKLRWIDATNLSGYVFNLDNCTGTFVNDTWRTMTGIGNWSNVTKLVNSTVGCIINWKVYANDTFNYWNISQTYSLNTTENLSPRWYGNETSPSSAAYAPSQTYLFNVTWVDDVNFDKALIEHNFTGISTPHNDSFTGSVNGEYYFSVGDLRVGTYVWRSFGNDTINNWNITDQWTYTVSKGPTDIAVYLNGTAGNRNYQPNQVANFTVALNVSGKYVNLTMNISGWVNLTGLTPLKNYTALTTVSSYNITGYWLGDANYTSDSETWYASVTTTSTSTSTTTTISQGDGSNATTSSSTSTTTLNTTSTTTTTSTPNEDALDEVTSTVLEESSEVKTFSAPSYLYLVVIIIVVTIVGIVVWKVILPGRTDEYKRLKEKWSGIRKEMRK